VDRSITFDSKEHKDLIGFLIRLTESGGYLYRGYSSSNQLLPHIIRESAEDIEIELLKEFEKHSAYYISVSNPIDLMSYAQHYGLPTRLLDFTANPFIALFFALFKPKNRGHKGEDKDYYYIRYARKSRNMCFETVPISLQNSYFSNLSDGDNQPFEGKGSLIYLSTNNPLWKQAAELISEINNLNVGNKGGQLHKGIKEKKLLFIDPNHSNQRMIMQQGLFLLPYTLDEAEFHRIIIENTREIKIHKTLRRDLQRYLNAIGIDTFRLMPDLQSICEAVSRKVKEPHPAEEITWEKLEEDARNLFE